MDKKVKTIAGRLSRKLMLWILIILIGLSYFVFRYTNQLTRDFYSENYYNRTLINMEYTRRVLSDVYVAVTNNIYHLEQNLDNPDSHKEVMRRIVKNGTRISSCGISFIEDYYPQKGHRFCPYAWRSPVNTNVIETVDMGDTASDYYNSDWFNNVIETDSAYWSKPFYYGIEKKQTLTAYVAPIHDQSGRVVAVIGADVSLDWLTNKLNETDSTINANAPFASKILRENTQSYIINHDGKFITHPDAEHILKDNFFSHIEEDGNSEEEGLVGKIKRGIVSEQEKYEKYLFDGQKCYVFYTPIKYTDWTMVTVVPWQSIDTIGILNGFVILVLLAVVMIMIVVLCYFYMKNETMPLRQLTKVTNDLAKGKFDTPMPEIKYNNEIRRLCDSLEDMQCTLSSNVNEKDANISSKTGAKS